MILLTKEDLEALSQDERDLAKALGLDFASHKSVRRGHPQCTSGEAYILVTDVRCRLCGAKHRKIFNMEKRGNHLQSEEIARLPSKEEREETSIKYSSYIVRSCWNCQVYLSNLTKEDLIMKFLSYIRDSKNFVI